jgi:hypothetical protein
MHLRRGCGRLQWKRRIKLERKWEETEDAGRYALLKDAPILLKKEECVLDMEQLPNAAAVKGARTKLRKKDCA